MDALRTHRERQELERQAAGENWQEHGLMFTTSNGTPIGYRNLIRDFKKLLEAAGLPPIRFHDLRHTAASLMLNNGVPVIAVSRRLGHAKASITLDVYGHLIPSMQAEVADQIDDPITPVAIDPRPTLKETPDDLHPSAPDLHLNYPSGDPKDESPPTSGH